MAVCSFSNCLSKELQTHAVVKDHYGFHWFCDAHWSFPVFLFINLISGCVRNGISRSLCRRNHAADYYSEDVKYNTVKFQGKHWDLCEVHLAAYDEILGTCVLPDFED
jgi:hypothetical protein